MDNDGDFRRTYEEATLEHHTNLVEYHAELDRYNRALDYWNSLSQEERDEINREKEDAHRIGWTVLFILSSALFMWFIFKQKYSGEKFYMIWGGSSFFVFLISVFLYRIIGILVRGAAFGILATMISYYILVHFFEKDGHQLSWVGIAVFAIGFVGFISGIIFRPNASPKRPRKPATPKRSFYK